MKKLKQLILVSLLSISVTSNSFAQNFQEIKKNTPAPYDGYILDEPAATKIKNDLIDSEYDKKIIESQRKVIKLYEENEISYQKRDEIFSTQNTKLYQELKDQRSLTTTEKILYFGAGIVLTGASVYLAQRYLMLR